MITILKSVFPGTTSELAARVAAYNVALEEHKKSVGVPAPRETDLVEYLSSTGESFQVEEPITVPVPEAKAAPSVVWNGSTWLVSPASTNYLMWLITAHVAGVFQDGVTHQIKTADDKIVSLGISDLKSLAAVVLEAVQKLLHDPL